VQLTHRVHALEADQVAAGVTDGDMTVDKRCIGLHLSKIVRPGMECSSIVSWLASVPGLKSVITSVPKPAWKTKVLLPPPPLIVSEQLSLHHHLWPWAVPPSSFQGTLLTVLTTTTT
jgi:hypothetical protein